MILLAFNHLIIIIVAIRFESDGVYLTRAEFTVSKIVELMLQIEMYLISLQFDSSRKILQIEIDHVFV